MLNTQPMEGTPRSEGQELSKGEREDYATISSVSVYDQGYRDYINWCGKYNARCLQVLDIAITLDNKELAKMMVKAIKNDPEIISKRARSSDKDHSNQNTGIIIALILGAACIVNSICFGLIPGIRRN